MNSSHAYTADGATSAEFRDWADPSDTISRALSTMDGGEAFAFSIWRVPPEIDFRDLNLKDWPVEYMQAAGSADAMTIEMRRLENGTPLQYTIGRGGPRASRPGTVIPIGTKDGQVSVFADEVFDAAEASIIFRYYFDHETVPDQYSLRLLDMTNPPEAAS